MIKVKYRVEGSVKARYVRKTEGDQYAWCEQSADNPARDVAQGTCEAGDLPEDIRKQCDEYSGAFYAAEWPL